MDLPKTYNPGEVEDEIYKRWEQSGFFNPNNLEQAHDRYWKAEPFSIAMPPPNITAELHVGHAMFLTIQDLMVRHARMSGKKTLWLPGTDHAAIATQNVVERELWEKEKKTRHDIGRPELLRRIEEFIKKTRGRIQVQIRKMGSSCDWSREKYTLSPELSLAVRTAFKKLYDAGLIYRGERIVNWCPRCATTLADDEVEYREEETNIYYVLYPFSKAKGGILISTVRPETMLGDTAVAVHPENNKYKKYIGKTVMQPLLSRELPIIADQAMEKEYGTGAMKVTPAHDHHDFELAQKHKLEIIKVFGPDGKIDQEEAIDHGFEQYAGLSVRETRNKVVEDLKTRGFLQKTENTKHNLSLCYRCETAVEPIISKQWFVGVNLEFRIQNLEFRNKLKLPEKTTLREMALAATKSGTIKIVPERFAKIYLQWMENLRDWNISRQIWFGHQIPVWYCTPPPSSPTRGEENSKKFPLPSWEGQGEGELKMGFHKSVVPQVLQGKTKTYRLRDHNLQIGDQVAFENSQTGEIFGYGTIINVEKVPVKKIDLKDPAHRATYEKAEELIKRLKFHYPDREVNEDTKVFIYTYEFQPQNQTTGCGETIVAIENPAACPNCSNTNLTQDPDTLDTWFSSSLWTFSTLGWPKETQDLKTYHPTTIMETGYDILFFWVARMVLMTGFVLEDIPFRAVYLNGLVRDKKGRKMSKSLKNALDPLEVCKKYGTDALRLSLIMGATPGNDLKISEEKIAGFRNFANKLWNIARYILSTSKNSPPPPSLPKEGVRGSSLADQWILSELDNLIVGVNKNLAMYQYGLAAEELYDFTWNKFADWHVEISKIKNQKSNSKEILAYVLQTLLKLWHPFIPFVTEHIWAQFSEEMLMIQEYPLPHSLPPGEGKEKREYSSPLGGGGKGGGEKFPKLQSLITGLRNLRAEYRQDPAETFASYLELPKEQEWIKEQVPIIEQLARVKLNFEKIPADKKMPYFLWQNTRVYLIIPDFDPQKERALAQKDLKQVESSLKKLDAQLGKSGFLKKAPPEVVKKLKTDAENAKTRHEKLKEKIKSL